MAKKSLKVKKSVNRKGFPVVPVVEDKVEEPIVASPVLEPTSVSEVDPNIVDINGKKYRKVFDPDGSTRLILLE